MYGSSNCVVKVCEAWKSQYGVVPYKTYGTLPEALKASWDYPRPTMKGRTCNSLAGGCNVVRSTGTGAGTCLLPPCPVLEPYRVPQTHALCSVPVLPSAGALCVCMCVCVHLSTQPGPAHIAASQRFGM